MRKMYLSLSSFETFQVKKREGKRWNVDIIVVDVGIESKIQMNSDLFCDERVVKK